MPTVMTGKVAPGPQYVFNDQRVLVTAIQNLQNEVRNLVSVMNTISNTLLRIEQKKH